MSQLRIARVLGSIAIVLLAVPSWAEPEEVGTAPEAQEFGDWSVACDNGKRCEAVSQSKSMERYKKTEWGEAAMLHIRVARAADANAAPRVFVDRRVWGEQPSNKAAALTLHVYYGGDADRTGKPYRLLPLVKGQHEVDPRDVAAFLAESAKTTNIATRKRGDSDLHGFASSKGMVAALRYMDEAQGRRDTVTAIYGTGPRPPSHVPEPKALPRYTLVKGLVKGVPRDVSDDELRRNGMLICGVTAAPHTGKTYRLANGDQLWKVDCTEESTTHGPNNPNSIWFVGTTGKQLKLPKFPRPEQGRPALSSRLPNSEFDPATGLLTATFFYGKHGDCGWQRQWGWSGSEWQLVAARELHACVGIMPNGWLPTWRSEVLD